MPIAQAAFDNRNFSNENPIARGAIQTFAIVSGTTMTKPSSINGELVGYVYTCPSLTTDTTFTLTIQDKDGATLYTKADLAHNKTDPFYVHLAAADRRFLHGLCDMIVTYTTSQTATIVIVPIYK